MANELIIFDSKIFKPTGLNLPENMTYEEWERLINGLRKIGHATQWWWGDAIRFGEEKLPDKHSQALEEDDYKYQSLADAVWVCGRFDFSRRRENLPFSFHREVASLESKEQDELLDKCEKEGWTRKELRQKTKERKKDKGKREIELLSENEYKPIIIKGKFQDQTIEKIDHIITDPPYSKEYLNDWYDFAKFAESILKPSGFLITYTGHNIPDIIHVFDETGLIYYHQLILIHAGALAAIHPVKINAGYKPIFVYQKPPFKPIDNYINNLIQGTGREKDSHEWQQSLDELDILINSFTQVNDLILDPFAGSGTVGLACKKNHRRSILIDDRI